MYAYPQMYCSISEPWIARPQLDGTYIAVQRTLRARNSRISYHFLREYPLVKVVGYLEEYDLIKHEIPNAEFVQIESISHMAEIIAGSRFFIGNQSSGMAIAEGMGHPRIMEAFPAAHSVQMATPNGSDFFIQEALEYLVNEAIR